ncbi:MAG: endolytic transglycosylase MltG [Bacteriovoracaceae bacterium]
MKKTLFVSLVLAPLFLLLSLGVYVSFIFNQSYTGDDVVFEVRPGDTFGKINKKLFEKEIIPNKRLFHYYARYKGYLTHFRAGAFTIPRGVNSAQVLEILVHGQPNLTSITIPEGKNMYEIGDLLEASGICNKADFLEAVKHPDLISELTIHSSNLEGYLYPETYRFAPNTPAKRVVKTMIDLFNKKTEHINFNHPFLNKHQVIILASMVEKETGAKAERPAIAGVFTNRLKKKMRLESDPTTIYGIWTRYQGNIKKSDLLEVTPYNTYKIPALPMGPISNPSLEAIMAVLNPDQHEYLFFVSKNDGTHVFTKTYRDHSEAVDSFQRNSKARDGKSWRNLKQ